MLELTLVASGVATRVTWQSGDPALRLAFVLPQAAITRDVPTCQRSTMIWTESPRTSMSAAMQEPVADSDPALGPVWRVVAGAEELGRLLAHAVPASLSLAFCDTQHAVVFDSGSQASLAEFLTRIATLAPDVAAASADAIPRAGWTMFPVGQGRSRSMVPRTFAVLTRSPNSWTVEVRGMMPTESNLALRLVMEAPEGVNALPPDCRPSELEIRFGRRSTRVTIATTDSTDTPRPLRSHQWVGSLDALMGVDNARDVTLRSCVGTFSLDRAAISALRRAVALAVLLAPAH